MKTLFKLSLSIIITFLTIPALANDFVIATGSEGGKYESIGNQLAAYIDRETRSRKAQKEGVAFDFKVINSTGSGENIELLNSGEVQAALVQADALNTRKPSIPFKAKSAHIETVWWIYNVKNKFDNLSDIEGNKKVAMVLVEDSGAVFTMQSFVAEDSGYKVNYDSAIYVDSLYEAFDLVCEGNSDGTKIAGLLYVGGSLPNEVKQDFSKCVEVGEATDSDFNDATDINKDKLYVNCTIPNEKYRPLKGASTFSEDTVCVRAMVVYSTNFEKPELKVISKGITKALKQFK